MLRDYDELKFLIVNAFFIFIKTVLKFKFFFSKEVKCVLTPSMSNTLDGFVDSFLAVCAL